MRFHLISLIAFSCTINPALAATRYVNVSNPSPASPYLTWATASTNIQNAINAASVNDTILVTNGTYEAGSVGNPYFARIFTTGKASIIQSVNGPEVTIIKGSTNSGAFLRCAYLTVGSVLSGFTLTTGKANTPLGGGVYCEDSSCIVTNCIITGNNSSQFGGGAFGGTLRNCILSNNVAGTGGGTCSNILFDCTLVNNTSSSDGAGARGCSLSNCLLVANICSGSGRGGAAALSTLKFCTVSNNAAPSAGGLFIGAANNSLISSNRATSGNGGGVFSNVLNNCVLQNNVAASSGGGGGAFQSTMTNCVVENNFAGFAGGGAYGGILVNCTVATNTAGVSGGLGGGAYTSTLVNSLLVANTAAGGGGVAYGIVTNCTIVGNTGNLGSGSYNCSVQNSIIYYNQSNDAVSSLLSSCCASSLTNNTTINSFTNEPLFVDISADFHLQSSSPCINAGINPAFTNKTDLDGNPRITGGTVDVGAYEFQSPTSLISYAWLQQYGLPIDGSADYGDIDNDGMNNWQEWIAGTAPDDSLSLLRMNSAIPTNDLSSATITWQSVTNKKYFLQRSADLSAFSTIQSNIIGQADTTSYTDSTATNSPTFFYRVGVQ